jgi:hypothetical protein
MAFGGVFDVAIIALVSKLLGVGGHINHGPFGAFGLPFFPPFAWTIWFLMFFYFMPEKLVQIVFFVLTAAAASVMFSNVLVNLGIFTWNYGKVIVPFIIYGVWFSLSASGYKRLKWD